MIVRSKQVYERLLSGMYLEWPLLPEMLGPASHAGLSSYPWWLYVLKIHRKLLQNKNKKV